MTRLIAVSMISLLVGLSVLGQVPEKSPLVKKEAPQASPAPTQQMQPHEMTATDVESFLDGLVPLQIAKDNIAGVTISIVKDGKLLFERLWLRGR